MFRARTMSFRTARIAVEVERAFARGPVRDVDAGHLVEKRRSDELQDRRIDRRQGFYQRDAHVVAINAKASRGNIGQRPSQSAATVLSSELR